jgi:hypothetical protein
MKNKNSYIQLSDNFGFLFLFIYLAWSVSVAQPIMAIFGEQPVFLVAHEIRGWMLFLVTLVLNFIPPILLWLIVSTLGLASKKIKEWLARSMMVILLTLYFLPLFNNNTHIWAMLIAVISSIIALFFLLKYKLVNTFALWLAPTGLIFIVAFLFFSSAKQLFSFQDIDITNNKTQSNGPVFVFVLDEFPSLSLLKDKNLIDESRFPTFAKLSKEISWYPNATTIASATEVVIPAILTGIRPKLINRKLGTFEQYPDNLFTLFSQTHNIHAIENTTRMCPPYLCKSQIEKPYQLLLEDTYISFLHRIYPNNIKDRLPSINDRWVGFLRELKHEKKRTYNFSERLTTFNQFINDFENHPENTVHFLHVLLPHAPWRILPDLKLYGFYERDGVAGEITIDDKKTLKSHTWEEDKWAAQLSWRKHLLQIGAVDSLIGKAINKMKALKLYDQATIVIVGDHGSAFNSGQPRRYALGDNTPQIANIPLFIKYPNQSLNNVDERYANNLDVMPTLMDIFSLKSSKTTDGLSLYGENKREKILDIIQENRTLTKLPENYLSLIKQYLSNKKQTFPSEGWKGIYQPLDSQKFYNKKVKSLIINNVHTNAIKLLNPHLFKSLSNKSQYVPSYYRTQLLLDDYKAHEIIVALNDKLISHCYMFVHENKDCAGLIDPLELLAVQDSSLFNFRFFSVISQNDGQYIVDELLTHKKEIARIVKTKTLEKITFESTQSLTINRNSSIYGNAKLKLVNNNSTYHLSGWAGDTVNGIPAKNLYVFLDESLIIKTPLGVPKPHLVDTFGFESLYEAGFQIPIPVSQYPSIGNHSIRVFAGNGEGDLAELNYHSDKLQVDLFKAFDNSNNRKIPTNAAILISKKILKIKENNTLNYSVIDAFNNDFPLISTGEWHGVKKHVRWIGATAYIGFPVTVQTKSLKFHISAMPYIKKEIVENQQMLVYINDKLVKSINFSKSAKMTFDIELDQDLAETIIVKLIMPDAASPSALGLGNDSRHLSFLVSDFRIEML